jgi:4-amino-4-deoxy-L-arabinose transferase-like glycosyltransferase
VGLHDSTHPTESSPKPLGERHSVAFLWCWIIVYFAFFSASRTKLPNYVLPLYPAVALLTARFLQRWRKGDIRPAAWTMYAAPVCLALLGIGTGVAMLLLGGVGSPRFLRGRAYPELANWATLGVLPIIGAAATWRCLWRGQRTATIAAFAGSAVAFLAILAAGSAVALERHKAPRELAHDLPADLNAHEVRIGAFQYFQPSLVFYCQREVQKLKTNEEMLEFLSCPLPVYLFVPATLWEQIQPRAPMTCHLLGRRHDLYRNCEVVVVSNR